jgi:hypothetical protein
MPVTPAGSFLQETEESRGSKEVSRIKTALNDLVIGLFIIIYIQIYLETRALRYESND